MRTAVFPTSILLLISSVTIADLSGQTASGLNDPRLQPNASVPQNNPPGTPIAQKLSNARAQAPSRGIIWNGLTIDIADEAGALPPGIPIDTAVQQVYATEACKADLIATGHITASACHLAASGTAIYTDYLFVPETLLKDNPKASASSLPYIVVTRPGGSLVLPDGPVTFTMHTFPQLQVGITYLAFLRYIPTSSAYRARGPFSTLVLNGSYWFVAREAFSKLAIPGFARGTLEGSIRNWLTSCSQSERAK